MNVNRSGASMEKPLPPEETMNHPADEAHECPRDFLVLTTQRTGSSWLMDIINHQPGVEGHMELFYHEPRREPPRAGCNDYPRFVESRHTHAQGLRPFAVFRYLAALHGREAAAGFKLMYSQLREYPEILAYVIAKRLPVVHLVRENHLDVILSEELAKTTGRSHATVRDVSGRPVSLRLDTGVLCAQIERLARKQRFMRRLLRRLPNAIMETSYETLCADGAEFTRICEFLNIDITRPAGRESTLVKRQQARHAEVIENYAAVRQLLEKQGYAALLDD